MNALCDIVLTVENKTENYRQTNWQADTKERKGLCLLKFCIEILDHKKLKT